MYLFCVTTVFPPKPRAITQANKRALQRQVARAQDVTVSSMACTMDKVLGDARTLLERLKEHDLAAEGLIEQSGALSQRVQGMKEVGNALPDKVRPSNVNGTRCCSK